MKLKVLRKIQADNARGPQKIRTVLAESIRQIEGAKTRSVAESRLNRLMPRAALRNWSRWV